MPWVIDQTATSLKRILVTEAEPLLLAGANPTAGLPKGDRVKLKGDQLTAATGDLAAQLGVRFSDNWSDPVLAQRQYWSSDRLHLAPVGLARVASNVLRTLGHPTPADWLIDADPIPKPTRREE